MRIESSEMQLQATSVRVAKEKEVEKLVYWEGKKEKTEKSINGGSNSPGAAVDLSKKAQEMIGNKSALEEATASLPEKKDATVGVKDDSQTEAGDQLASRTSNANRLSDDMAEEIAHNKERMQIRLIEEFMRALTGKKFTIKFSDLAEPKKDQEVDLLARVKEPQAVDKAKENVETKLPEAVGWGVSYERLYERQEYEKMTFSASGIVKTADGKEISLKLDLSMSRTLYERSYTSIKAGDALIDPLVVNYAGAAADLTETKYSFDIDADGKQDEISFVKNGSGFLALDKNSDGKINDGNELFGTQSGNGFKDLAAYDKDSNGWIDENDDIFEKLRIWIKDDKGNDKLLTLKQAGIGAVYLGSVEGKIDIVGGDGKKNGQVSQTGIFLRENGLAGSVQHVDLSV